MVSFEPNQRFRRWIRASSRAIRRARRGELNEYRKIHRARARLHPECAAAGARPGPSAVFAGAPAQGAARRRRRDGRRADCQGGRRCAHRAGRDRGRPQENPKSLRRCRPALSEPRVGAGVRHGRERGAEGRRFLRHGRAAVAGPDHREGHRCRQDSRFGRGHAAGLERSNQRDPQGSHRQFRFGREPVRRAEEICPRPDRGGPRGQDRSSDRPR